MLQPALQAGLDKLVQVTIQYCLGITHFHAGTQVFNTGLVKYVRTNLAAPADIRLGLLKRLLVHTAFLYLQLVQLGLELLHRGCLVLVLGTVILTLHDNTARFMRDTHSRFGAIHMLATGAAGPVHINTQVGRIDINIDIIINLRRNKHRGE